MLGRKCAMSSRTEGPTTTVHIVAACAHAVLRVSQCVSELFSLKIPKMPILTEQVPRRHDMGPPPLSQTPSQPLSAPSAASLAKGEANRLKLASGLCALSPLFRSRLVVAGRDGPQIRTE